MLLPDWPESAPDQNYGVAIVAVPAIFGTTPDKASLILQDAVYLVIRKFVLGS
jgi:hypothetical protein